MPSSQDDLLALAERALARVSGEGQVTAWWERQLTAMPGSCVTTDGVSVEVAVLRDGRVGTAVTTDTRKDALVRAADGAARVAAHGPAAVGELPAPAEGRAHDGYDPAIAEVDPADPAAALEPWSSWRAAAAKTAIVSTRGVRAYEERSFVDARVRRHADPGRSLELTVTAARLADVDPVALHGEAGELLGPGEPVGVAAGEYAVVLGPWAVAEVLRRAALALGGPLSPLTGRLGTPVAAPAVNLSDSPRFAATLPRAFDAEGAPRQPLPLIQDGVAHRLAGPGTGHALQPGATSGTLPEHLVLVGGGAADLTELAVPLDHGLYIPALSLHGSWVVGRRGAALAEGVRMIRAGALAEPAANLTVVFEPFELLARTEALTARQRTIPPPVQRSARTASATVAPGGRFGGGLFVA
ncbi:MAG TPA: metallopeptidase TldD-related protein [Solirubrobacteraceae bacterium]|nr:metallopeptidase TldD-related protein [Solirubrobacteraceae bacterium]